MTELRNFPRNSSFALALLLLSVSHAAFAGPPYVTDDPEPTDAGHWEIYNFAAGLHVPGDTAGQAGLDINYGGAEDLQLTAVVPLDYRSHGEMGVGDIELAAKYRFLRQIDGTPVPDVAFFPRIVTPVAGRQFGPQRFSYQLPLWAEKDWGAWSLFGGVSYDINPGAGNRNFWLTGLALSRALSDAFSLGLEVFHQTATVEGEKSYTAVNLGGSYRLTDHWSLLASGGPGVQNPRREGEYDFYVALKADY